MNLISPLSEWGVSGYRESHEIGFFSFLFLLLLKGRHQCVCVCVLGSHSHPVSMRLLFLLLFLVEFIAAGAYGDAKLVALFLLSVRTVYIYNTYTVWQGKRGSKWLFIHPIGNRRLR